jgi:hypothetical protein
MQKFRYAGGVPDEGGQPLMLAGNFHCDGRLSKLCSGLYPFSILFVPHEHILGMTIAPACYMRIMVPRMFKTTLLAPH